MKNITTSSNPPAQVLDLIRAAGKNPALRAELRTALLKIRDKIDWLYR